MSDETTTPAGVDGDPPEGVNAEQFPTPEQVPDSPEDERVQTAENAGSTDSVVTTMEPPIPHAGPGMNLKDVLQTGEHEEQKGDHSVVWGGRYALRIQRRDGDWICIGWNGVPNHRTDEQLKAEYEAGQRRAERTAEEHKL